MTAIDNAPTTQEPNPVEVTPTQPRASSAGIAVALVAATALAVCAGLRTSRSTRQSRLRRRVSAARRQVARPTTALGLSLAVAALVMGGVSARRVAEAIRRRRAAMPPSPTAVPEPTEIEPPPLARFDLTAS